MRSEDREQQTITTDQDVVNTEKGPSKGQGDADIDAVSTSA